MPTITPIADPGRWRVPDHSPDVAKSLERLRGLSWASWELAQEVRNQHLAGVTALPRKLRRRLAAARAACAAEETTLEQARAHARAVVIANRNRRAAVLAAKT